MKNSVLKNKKLLTFSLASFLNDLGSDIVSSLWPMFVVSVLGANLAFLGFIDGLGKAVVSISKGFSGYLSDKIRNRKIFVWTGYLMSGASRIGYALSANALLLVPFKILDRSGKVRGAPRDAMVASLTEKKHRGTAFGFLRAMDTLGAVAGTIIAFSLLGFLGYRNLFLLAAIPSLIGGLLIFFFIKEKRKGKLFKGFSFRNLNRNLKVFFVAHVLFSFAFMSYSFIMVLARVYGVSEPLLPLFYLLFNVVYFSFAYPLGRYSDKIGRKKVLLLSYSIFALLCVIAFATNVYSVFLLFILFGFVKAGVDPVTTSFISDLSPAQGRASVLGAFQMAAGLSALPAGLILGMLWDFYGLAAPFTYSLALTLLAIATLTRIKGGSPNDF